VRRAFWLCLATVAFPCAAWGQLYTSLPDSVAPRLDSGAIHSVDTAFARRFVDAASCGAKKWTPDFATAAGLQTSLAPYRQLLAKDLGILPITLGGQRLDGHVVYSDSSYELSYVLYTSRLLNVSTAAYILRPLARVFPPRAVILLHGVGMLPEQSFGLRIPGDGAGVTRPDSSTFIGLGLSLAQRGYTIIAPVVWEEPASVSTLPWSTASRLGFLYAMKIGSGGALTLLESQVLATVDYSVISGLAQPGNIAIAGWEEGALLGSVAAIADARIGAVIRLSPPIDRSRFRLRSFDRIDAAPFMQIDCSVDERVQSALALPRRFLWVWTDAEAATNPARRYIDTTVVADVRREAMVSGYDSAAVRSVRVAGPRANPGSVVANWLDGQFFFAKAVWLAPPKLAIPQAETFPGDVVNDQQNKMSGFVGSIGSCKTIDTGFVRVNTERLGGSRLAVANAIRQAAKIRTHVPTGIRSVSRVELGTAQGYRLAEVTVRLSDFEVPVVGLLATPLQATRAAPAVVSFNGDDGVLQAFGYEPPHLTPYMHGYADYYARRGYVVFVPYLPIWFTNAGSSTILSRDVRNSSWSAMVPYYEAAVSFVESLPNVDPQRIAAYGISFGGVAALVTTAVDARLSALVYSNIPLDQRALFSTGAGGLVPTWWIETCGYIDAAFDAIAPRRFVWEAGEDSTFENPGYDAVLRMRDHYIAAGAPQQFQFVRHGGGHETRPGGFEIFRSAP